MLYPNTLNARFKLYFPLHLLPTYNLTDVFTPDAILKTLKEIAQHQKSSIVVDLCLDSSKELDLISLLNEMREPSAPTFLKFAFLNQTVLQELHELKSLHAKNWIYFILPEEKMTAALDTQSLAIPESMQHTGELINKILVLRLPSEKSSPLADQLVQRAPEKYKMQHITARRYSTIALETVATAPTTTATPAEVAPQNCLTFLLSLLRLNRQTARIAPVSES